MALVPQPEDLVLLVEDDRELAREIVRLFDQLALTVVHIGNGTEGLKKALAEDYALVLLDIQLPGTNGFDICRELRAVKPDLPIIILTTRGEKLDRVLGFELGADDYVVKPFQPEELLARVRSKLRRAAAYRAAAGGSIVAGAAEGTLELEGLLVNPESREVKKNGVAVSLTAKEFDLLYFLMQRPGVVFSKMELLREIWKLEHPCYEESVVSMVRRLRRKIDETGTASNYIRTVHRVGYSFLGPEVQKPGTKAAP